MTTGTSIAVVGSLNRDYVFTVDRLPGPGETRLGDTLTLSCGGKGANQAVAASLLGAAHGIGVVMVGAVGRDPDGAALRAALSDAGVNVETIVVRPGVPTGAALITVAGNGENTIIVAPGANASITADEVVLALARNNASIVLTQGELPVDVVAQTVRTAVAQGARAVLNLAPVVPVDPSVLALCDPLVVNESEAAELLGRTGVHDAASAARELRRRARSVAVTAGAAGAYVAVDDRLVRVPAPRVRAVDTSGAGDAFTGALAVALAAGLDVPAAAARACLAGAYAVTRTGAQLTPPLDIRLDVAHRAR